MFLGTQMDKFYDQIACEFDQLVQEDIKNNQFPYAAYDALQDIIIEYVYENKHISKAKILDIGIGTASLYEKIMPDKLDLTGIDISKRMLEVAKLRIPEAKLISHDILKGLPEEILTEKYDYIVINYLFKHFDSDFMINLVNLLSNLLSPFGKIFIGDILFLDETCKKTYLTDHPDNLNPNYYYHTFSEVVNRSDDLLALSFMELNYFTGLLIIEKYYESALHFEETLIKYKSNTVKWKSSRSQKKRE